MLRTRRYTRALPVTLLAAALLAACGSQNPGAPATAVAPPAAHPTAPASAPQPTAAPAPTSVPTPVPQPTAAPTVAPQPTPSPATAGPALIYLDAGAVFAQPIGGDPSKIAALPGAALDAAMAGDALLVLRERQLDLLELSSGALRTIVKFESPAQPGSRLRISGKYIFYGVRVDDPNAVFGKTLVGYYNTEDGSTKRLAVEDGLVEPLGLTPQRDGLYILPRGGDPAFGQIQVVDLASGKIVKEIQVDGEGAAPVSPDGRYLATTIRRFGADPNAEPDNLLYLYDLTAKQVAPHEIALPHAPSAANAVLWSPDSRAFYFALGTGNLYELKESLGLWSYDLSSGEAHKVSDASVVNTWNYQVSGDGGAVFHRGNQGGAELVDLATGGRTSIGLPAQAIVVGWR